MTQTRYVLLDLPQHEDEVLHCGSQLDQLDPQHGSQLDLRSTAAPTASHCHNLSVPRTPSSRTQPHDLEVCEESIRQTVPTRSNTSSQRRECWKDRPNKRRHRHDVQLRPSRLAPCSAALHHSNASTWTRPQPERRRQSGWRLILTLDDTPPRHGVGHRNIPRGVLRGIAVYLRVRRRRECSCLLCLLRGE